MQVLIAISGFCGFCSRIGNTPCTTPFDFLYVISIHVPAWGTTGLAAGTSLTNDFNPRSRVGNDRKKVSLSDKKTISIHVPAWGTTAASDLLLLCLRYFNPRSRVGNDRCTAADPGSPEISIHVPAWGTTPAQPWQGRLL